MDTQSFKVFRNGTVLDSLLVSDWIDGIQTKQSPDGLSVLGAKHIYPSIGGKGLGLETMYGGSKKVPLFEFRDLKNVKPREFQKFVVEAEQGIMMYSQRHSDTAKTRHERGSSTSKAHPDLHSKGIRTAHHLSGYSFTDPGRGQEQQCCECARVGKYEVDPHGSIEYTLDALTAALSLLLIVCSSAGV
jgi:hypothetical protein